MSPVQIRRPWLLLYLGVNVIAACMMAATGELVGDVAGSALYSSAALAIALGLTLLAYTVILGPLFRFLERVAVRPAAFARPEPLLGRRIGILLLCLQCLYVVFNQVNGVNQAGVGRPEESVPFALFWVFMPVDALMIVYYGNYRDNRYFYPNAVVWAGSNLARGWSGVLFFIMFFEWCRAARRGRLRPGVIVGLGLGAIVLYPLLFNLKWLIRASAATNLGLSEMADGIAAAFGSQDYLAHIEDGLTQIIGRFQTTANLVEVMRLRDALQADFARGLFTPFWREGLHGIIVDRLFDGVRSTPIGVAFTDHIADHPGDLGSWNTNIGFAGWFFIAPAFLPVYLLYNLLLAWLSMFLVKKIGATEQTGHMLWFVWLLYLLPPWHAAFVGFLYALCVFLAMKHVFSLGIPLQHEERSVCPGL